jgi:hypothetical protein
MKWIAWLPYLIVAGILGWIAWQFKDALSALNTGLGAAGGLAKEGIERGGKAAEGIADIFTDRRESERAAGWWFFNYPQTRTTVNKVFNDAMFYFRLSAPDAALVRSWIRKGKENAAVLPENRPHTIVWVVGDNDERIMSNGFALVDWINLQHMETMLDNRSILVV